MPKIFSSFTNSFNIKWFYQYFKLSQIYQEVQLKDVEEELQNLSCMFIKIDIVLMLSEGIKY